MFITNYIILKLLKIAKKPFDYVRIIKLISNNKTSTDELLCKLINIFKTIEIKEEDTRLISQIVNNKNLYNLSPIEEYSILTIWLSLLFIIEKTN